MMVADIDVLIDYLQGKGRPAGRIALELEHAHLCTTAVTRFELRTGAVHAAAEPDRSAPRGAALSASRPCCTGPRGRGAPIP